MNRSLLLAVVMLLAAVAAHADVIPGAYLNWGDQCYGANPQLVLDWACDSNTGGPAAVLTVSFASAESHDDLVGVVIELWGNAAPHGLEDWWRMGAGECRSGALSMTANFTRFSTGCADPWQGNVLAGIASYASTVDRIGVDATCEVTDPIAIVAGTEYTCAQFTISRTKTVGPEACLGCEWPMCLSANVELQFAGSGPEFLGTPYFQRTGWHQECWVPDAARTTTWGQIKSLYR